MLLRYGVNPHQAVASYEAVGGRLPFEVVSGQPGYINLLDALNAWQLVREASLATGMVTAASFKHVSPAGVATSGEVPDFIRRTYRLPDADLTAPASAYLRARSSDPRSSYGDFIALSDPVDEATARVIKLVVSDGIIAPDYSPAALEVLQSKRRGSYLIIRSDPAYTPPRQESREVFGVRLTQTSDTEILDPEAELRDVIEGKLRDQWRLDLILGLVTVKYTQSNSVAFARSGQVIGIGAGQQSRIDCTRLAGAKTDNWWLVQHPRLARELADDHDSTAQDRINDLYSLASGTGEVTTAAAAGVRPLTPAERVDWLRDLRDVCFASDGYIPFPDNIVEVSRHGAVAVAAPGGSIRDAEVREACRTHDICLVYTPHRYFHH